MAVNVVFAGDSITRAAYAEAGTGWAQRLTSSLATSYPLVTWGTFSNEGYDGAKSTDWQGWVSSRIATHSPNIVTLFLGVNDAVAQAAATQTFAQYQAAMRSTIAQINAISPAPKLILIKPIELGATSYGVTQAALQPYADFYDTLASENPAATLIDAHSLALVNPTDYVSWDKLHPNNSGHTKLAALIAPYVGTAIASITITAPRSVRTSVEATFISTLGGTLRFTGTHADRFTCSLNGTDYAATQTLPAGTSTVYLGVTPQADDTTLTARVGVPV